MKLINYIIQNAEEIDNIKSHAKINNIPIDEYILTYCPSYFKSLKNTQYEKPYTKHKSDKNDCKYNDGNSLDKCVECWNRKVLILTEGKKQYGRN